MPATTQFEVMDYVIDLTGRPPGEPVPLPPGWQPLNGTRRANELILLLVREADTVADE